LKIFQSRTGLRWLILVPHSGGAGTPGQLNRTDSGRRTMLTNRPQNGQTLSRSLSRTRFSLVPRTSSSPQRTLACCPPPAQVFSQQLPNQHAIFFSDFKNIKWFQKLTFHGGMDYFNYYFSKFPSNKKYLKCLANILFS
jgi:hypothetical protein